MGQWARSGSVNAGAGAIAYHAFGPVPKGYVFEEMQISPRGTGANYTAEWGVALSGSDQASREAFASGRNLFNPAPAFIETGVSGVFVRSAAQGQAAMTFYFDASSLSGPFWLLVVYNNTGLQSGDVLVTVRCRAPERRGLFR